MITTEIERIAAALHRIRPDWRADSLATFITTHLADRPYRDTLIALCWVATDPRTQTPNLVLSDGPWWAACRPPVEPEPTPQPPSTATTCIDHGNTKPCQDCAAHARGVIRDPARIRAIREEARA